MPCAISGADVRRATRGFERSKTMSRPQLLRTQFGGHPIRRHGEDGERS